MVYMCKLCYIERIVSCSTVDPIEIKTEICSNRISELETKTFYIRLMNALKYVYIVLYEFKNTLIEQSL